jgi:hypothetical protein
MVDLVYNPMLHALANPQGTQQIPLDPVFPGEQYNDQPTLYQQIQSHNAYDSGMLAADHDPMVHTPGATRDNPIIRTQTVTERVFHPDLPPQYQAGRFSMYTPSAADPIGQMIMALQKGQK